LTAPDHQATATALLTRAVLTPAELLELSPSDLDLAIRVARRARLLGRICVALENAGLLDQLPGVAADQLLGAKAHAASRTRLALWELDRIAWAVRDDVDYPLIVMKGCAYILLETPNAPGRFFADVDLMVPEADLEPLETRLNRRGWKTADLSPYDQNYYRNWTHELPPLMHIGREVEIDLHHNILPRTARLKPRSDILLESARPVPGAPYHVLCNEDVVLHAITHLMFGDDMADRFRDLVDIRDLLAHFSESDPEFWNRLVARAKQLDLRRPMFYALRYTEQLLDLDIPDGIGCTVHRWGPPGPVRRLMDKLVPDALFPWHPDHPRLPIDLARQLLYIRSHWIRMPPWLLAYHLSYKFYLTKVRRVSRH
jgi:hypothetical protein